MNKLGRNSIIALLTGALFYSCHTQKDVVKEKPINHKSADFLIEQLHENEFVFEWINSKASINIQMENKNLSFTANLRIRKDSIIWISISPALGIEVVRVYISKDSVKFINRMNNTYFLGNFQYINDFFDEEFHFDMLQSLLIGNSIDLDEDDKYKSSVDRKNDLYLISTFKKRRLRKAIEKEKVKGKIFDDIIYSIWLEPKHYKIKQFSINDFKEKKAILINYADFKLFGELLFPHKVDFQIQAEKNINISISYSKFHTNKPLEFPFSIPEKYERIN